MTVTDVQSYDKKRSRVFIEGEYAFWLYNSEVRKYQIAVGCDISSDDIEEIYDMLTRRVRERILYLIGDCDRSERDIRNKMTGAGYPTPVVDRAIDILKEYRYIDDERFAANYAKSLMDNHAKSRREIIGRLYDKGISREIIDYTISEMDLDEHAQIVKALKKKGLTVDELKKLDMKELNKIYGFLARRGFSPEQIRTLFSENIFD